MGLKTLKEIKEPCEVHVNEYMGVESDEKMSEHCVEKKALRQEAIKWIRELEKIPTFQTDAVIEFIKLFFNIEENSHEKMS